jgi:hydroxyacylglutathione hydrolase
MTDTNPSPAEDPHGTMTLWGIGPRLILLTALYAVPIIIAQYAGYPRFLIQGVPDAVFIVLGSALIVIGLPIWVWASRSVDRAYDEGTLATQGAYALCRHPIYGNAIFFSIPGILLFFRSWLLLSIPVAAYLFCKLLLRKEEERLRRKFGSAYRDYEKAVPALFPKVWNVTKCFFYPAPTIRLDENVSAVRDGDVNMFLYTDGADTIAVDAGYSAKAVSRELRRLAVDPSSVTHLFLTHTDLDHAGGLALLSHAQIFLSSAEEQMIDGRTARFLGIYRNARIPRPYSLLQDGDLVAAGKIRIRAIATPGHTPGSMSFLVDEKVLFSGDTLTLQNGRVDTFYALLTMDIAAQRESIRKLAALQGIKLLCTAHTGSTRKVDDSWKRWRRNGQKAEIG